MPGGFAKIGNLAIIAFYSFRPIALRPRLSPGLPFSIYLVGIQLDEQWFAQYGLTHTNT